MRPPLQRTKRCSIARSKQISPRRSKRPPGFTASTEHMAEQTEAAVLSETSGAVAWITLNRPHAMNAINEEVRMQLPAALRAADADSGVRVIVIKGAGERAFCAGADIKGFTEAPTPARYRANRLQGAWVDAIDETKKPVIASIHGFCLGG